MIGGEICRRDFTANSLSRETERKSIVQKKSSHARGRRKTTPTGARLDKVMKRGPSDVGIDCPTTTCSPNDVYDTNSTA